MKKNKNTNRNASNSKPVWIEFSHPTAQYVSIAGTFNDWRPEVTHMIPVGDGRWRKVLALDPGAHEYLLVADGEWLPDPEAKESVSNPYGGVNSIVRV